MLEWQRARLADTLSGAVSQPYPGSPSGLTRGPRRRSVAPGLVACGQGLGESLAGLLLPVGRA